MGVEIIQNVEEASDRMNDEVGNEVGPQEVFFRVVESH